MTSKAIVESVPMGKRHFHLAWFLSQGYGPKTWRSDWPGSDVSRWMMPDLFVDLARAMDRACFDYVIIEDSSNVPYTYQGSHDTYLKYAASTPKLDPAVLVPYLAQATTHLGLVPTLSVSEYPPYLLARLVNTLDHVTEGRIGWNCVTGSNDGAAQNYGHEKHRPHDERYDVADEFARSMRSTTRASISSAAARSTRRARRRAACRSARPAARRAARSSPRAGPTPSSRKAAAASRQ